MRISVLLDDQRPGRIEAMKFEADGCAALRACAAAVCEELEGASVLDATLAGAERIADLVGGLTSQGRHAAELVADALGRAITAAASTQATLAEPPPQGERTLVAFSGGVDSSVAALLEQRRGADVVAVTLKLWADPTTDGTQACCSPEAVRGARATAHAMGIPHLTLDLEDAFRARVVDDFIAGYRAGETPNPCVRCNGSLRIEAMVALADRLGATRLATGHYARIADDGEGPLLTAPADDAKDQTYMLSGLEPALLTRLRFPLEGLRKDEVRKLAADAGVRSAHKRESQDLCFLAGEGKRAFLARRGGLVDRPGEIVDERGAVVGSHPGHHNFTVGQRKGVGIGAAGEPFYVLATDAERNRITVGRRERLATDRIRVRDARLLRAADRADRVRLRSHAAPLACTVSPAPAGRHDELELRLAEPILGIAPGQTACLMDGPLVVGRATVAAARTPALDPAAT